MSSVRIGAKMAFFRGFGPRRAAVWAEQPFFSFAIIFYHPKEHSLRVSALYSKIFLNYTFGLDILRSALGTFQMICVGPWLSIPPFRSSSASEQNGVEQVGH